MFFSVFFVRAPSQPPLLAVPPALTRRRPRPAWIACALAWACSGPPSTNENGRTDAPSAGAREPAAAPAPDTPAPAPTPADPDTAPAPAPEEPETAKPVMAIESLPDEYLRFDGACAPGPRVTLAAVGDILLHEELQRQAYADPERHASLWRGVVDLLQRADITYANLEGPTATGVTRSGKLRADPGLVYDNKVYTAYPRFNYHPSLVESLVQAGVDIVSTANNHALDRHAIGVDKTIDALTSAGLPFTGTRKQHARRGTPWHALTTAKGFTIAWIACAHHTNQIPDEAEQVLYCFRGDEVVDTIRRLHKQRDIDAVIAVPHWGKEYKTSPRKQQVSLAHRMAEAGASAIIGSHPHVLQPWEKYLTKDDREVFIHYSLGNFASHQPELPQRSTILLYVGLTRGEDDVVRVNGVRYMPLHVTQRGETFTTEAIDRVGGLEDSRALTVAMYGRHNLLPPSAPLQTNAHCHPGFEFPER